MSKLPAIQMYPGDWQRDAVAGCSLAARGLWWEMLQIMHDCKPYGHLTMDGKPMPDTVVARRCRCQLTEYRKLLSELFLHGVPRRNELEIIYSKRMVEDEKLRKAWRKRQKRHRKQKRDVTGGVTAMSRLSSSSSSSSLSSSNLKSSSDDDPHTLLPELARQFPSYQLTAEDVAWACEVVRSRANSPPGSLAYWRKALARFFENADAEIAAYRKRTEIERELRAGQNLQGRTQ